MACLYVVTVMPSSVNLHIYMHRLAVPTMLRLFIKAIRSLITLKLVPLCTNNPSSLDWLCKFATRRWSFQCQNQVIWIASEKNGNVLYLPLSRYVSFALRVANESNTTKMKKKCSSGWKFVWRRKWQKMNKNFLLRREN